MEVTGPLYKSYVIFWFKRGARSVEIRDHLKLLKVRRE
jgi:hypothetical protein